MCGTIKRQDKTIRSSVVIEAVLRQVACDHRVGVVSRITNSFVEQAVIVIISVVSIKCELSKFLLQSLLCQLSVDSGIKIV